MSERQQIPQVPSCTSSRVVLRRKCACGARTASNSGSCPECERRPLRPKLVVGGAQDAEEREADRVANAVMRDRGGPAGGSESAITSMVRRSSNDPSGSRSDAAPEAPSIVDEVLAGSGQALDPGARRFFESRFRRDFSSVRLHTDSRAAASASAVNAHAYTVGSHIVFGASRYAPGTIAGRHLLAHELTHVVQQGAVLRRDSISPPVEGHGNDEEEEQPVRRLQRHPAIVGLDEAGPDADLTGKREAELYQLSERDKKLAECKKAAGADPPVCDPATPPGWGSFTAAPAAGSSFGAMTFSFIQGVDVPSQKCEETIVGVASGPKKRFQGKFTPDKSWVKPEFRDAGDPTKNGSAAQVGACEAHFDREAAAGRTGGWWALNSGASPTCAASARARGDRATKKDECATVVAADFNDRAVAESSRLLRHEQTHFALSCAMAKKGNDLLTAGTTFDKIDAVIHTKLSTAQSQYDGQTQHGCVAAQQSSWETAIAAGLPDIKLI